MGLSLWSSIRTKLVSGFLIVVMMSALIGGIAFNQFRSTESLVSDEVMKKAEARHLSTQIILKSNFIFALVNDYLLATQESRKVALSIIINDGIRTLEEYLHQVSVQKLTLEERGVLSKLEELFFRYSNLIKRILQKYGDKKEKNAGITADIHMFREIHFSFITSLQHFESIETRNMYDSWDFARHKIHVIKILLLLLSGIALILGVSLGIASTRMVTVPIGKLLKTLEDYGNGNFDVRAEVPHNDEMGYLAERFNIMLGQIRKYAEVLMSRNRELDQSQKQLQILTDTTPDAVMISTPDGRISTVNQTFLEMFGYSREEMLTLNARQISGEEPSQGEIQENIDRAFNEDGLDFTWLCKKKNEEQFPVNVRLRKMHIGDDISILAIITDFTEQKRIEDEKKQVEDQLLHAQKMEAIGTLAGGVAHDFNNVLQAISGYNQLLMINKSNVDSDYSYLKQIDRSIQRATELVQQLLIFSRKVESKLRPVDLNQEIVQIKNILKRTIPRMISIETFMSDDLNLINADPAQLEQLLMNLAVNASDAMPDGGKFVIESENIILDEEYCKIHLGATPGEYALLTVSDTGCGMDRETMEHIFEPFYTKKEVGKGTGLGLAMVYGIVKSHAGHIACYSEVGHGTTFKVYFPLLMREDDHQITEHEKELGMTEMAELPGGNETILLVDDEENILDIGRKILEQYGYTIVTATSGEHALQIYEQEEARIDLIILDLGMPGMGGHKCLLKLYAINPEMRVMIASGYSLNGSVNETIKAGIAGFIGKPYRLSDMLKKVREILDA